MSENEQPRQPRNLQGLLRFAMDATRDEDAPEPSNIQEMDPERRRFLEEALKSLTIDVIQEFEKAMNTLINVTENTLDDQVNALEVVQNFVDQIDNANDFYQVGGFTILLPCLNSDHQEIRTGGAEIIAELAQNNPFCQEKLVAANVFPRLIELLSDDYQSVAAGAMHAISCIVRSYKPGLDAFSEMGGLECILGSLQCKHEKVHVKVGFLISALTSEFDDIGDKFVDLNAIDHLTRSLKPTTGYNQRTETILAALTALCERQRGPMKLRKSSIDVINVLTKIISTNKGLDECLEIVTSCETLLKKIKGNDSLDDAER